MSTSPESASVEKQKLYFYVFVFNVLKKKQVLDSVFAISRIIKVSVRVIKQSQRLRMKTLCPDEELIDTER